MFAQPVISSIRHNDSGLFRIYGCVGEVCGVAQRAFRDSLEECRFADVSKADLDSGISASVLCLRRAVPTYDTTFQAVAWSAQQNLLFLDRLLGRHFSFSVAALL